MHPLTLLLLIAAVAPTEASNNDKPGSRRRLSSVIHTSQRRAEIQIQAKT